MIGVALSAVPKKNILKNWNTKADLKEAADGDKPRPYKSASTQWVGAGFIPARKALNIG
jgi:hypothetical protein